MSKEIKFWPTDHELLCLDIYLKWKKNPKNKDMKKKNYITLLHMKYETDQA